MTARAHSPQRRRALGGGAFDFGEPVSQRGDLLL
jgi:hypothetical protein